MARCKYVHMLECPTPEKVCDEVCVECLVKVISERFRVVSNANIRLSGTIQSVITHITSMKLMERAIEELPKLSKMLSLEKSSK